MPEAKVTAKVASKTPEDTDDIMAATQTQMLYMFPLMTILFGYQFQFGLVLYWLIFSAVSVVQQYFASGWGGLTPFIKKSMEDKIRELLSQFLTQLGYASPYEATVVFDPENKIYQITINTSDPAILVGYHGDTISSLQLLLSQHLHSQASEWTSISINVNDYRERRQQAPSRHGRHRCWSGSNHSSTRSPPPLPSNERRIIHVYLTDHPQVTTGSQGEGRFRTVVISPKE